MILTQDAYNNHAVTSSLRSVERAWSQAWESEALAKLSAAMHRGTDHEISTHSRFSDKNSTYWSDRRRSFLNNCTEHIWSSTAVSSPSRVGRGRAYEIEL